MADRLVWKKRIEGAKQYVGGKCEGYDDYRKVLDRKDIAPNRSDISASEMTV